RLSPRKAASATGKPTRLSARVTKASSCRTSTASPNTPSSPSSLTRAQTPSCGVRTHPFAARRSHRNDHLRQRKRVRLPRRNRRRIGCQILLCEALSLVGTRPQRTHKRPRQAVLPKRHRLLYFVERRRPKGRGQTQLPPPQDTRLPNPKRGFPGGRLTRLLHFTVEWAALFICRPIVQSCSLPKPYGRLSMN